MTDPEGRRPDVGADIDPVLGLDEAVIYEELASLRAPYVVLCSSHRHGPMTTSGPYPDALTALLAADRDRVQEARTGGRNSDVRFDVMRLFPPRRV